MSNNETLQSLSKDDLIKIINDLKGEVAKLNDDFYKVTNLRLYHLERSQNMFQQYNRRESFEIAGIPQTVPIEGLEDEVIEICKEEKVYVNRQPIKKTDIVAVHRLADKKTTVVRVMNRKFSREALMCGKNLRDSKRYGDGKIYINNSFCPEFRFLFYAIRKAAGKKEINRWKIRNGIIHIQKEVDGPFVEIGHVLDLENLKISIPERRNQRRE